MELSPGTGDKRILRQAALALGIDQCSYLVKRAIQFGTRVAKHTSVEYHGSIRKGKGTHKVNCNHGIISYPSIVMFSTVWQHVCCYGSKFSHHWGTNNCVHEI